MEELGCGSRLRSQVQDEEDPHEQEQQEVAVEMREEVEEDDDDGEQEQRREKRRHQDETGEMSRDIHHPESIDGSHDTIDEEAASSICREVNAFRWV